MANITILQKYMSIPQPSNQIQLMYIWIDGSEQTLRGKTKTVYKEPFNIDEVEKWNFDGSSTGQATREKSDVFLKPVRIYRDPFRLGKNKLILCETYDENDQPLVSNKRHRCEHVMAGIEKEFKPMFGLEQEYSIMSSANYPYGWPYGGYPAPQGPYSCGVGTGNAFGRNIVEAHFRACMYAGIKLFGSNAEVMASQWEYQVGTSDPMKMCDDLWMSRYILHRVAEDFNAIITFDPKPIRGNWNGAGGHINYSTIQMRTEGGIEHIMTAVKKLAKTHASHMTLYDPKGGEDNKRRMTGLHETSKMDLFSFGIATRAASVRINPQVAKDGHGYLEDRRPAANCDPYVVTRAIVETTLLNIDPIAEADTTTSNDTNVNWEQSSSGISEASSNENISAKASEVEDHSSLNTVEVLPEVYEQVE